MFRPLSFVVSKEREKKRTKQPPAKVASSPTSPAGGHVIADARPAILLLLTLHPAASAPPALRRQFTPAAPQKPAVVDTVGVDRAAARPCRTVRMNAIPLISRRARHREQCSTRGKSRKKKRWR